MYVDNLSGSTISMLEKFMESNETQLLIEDRFHVKGYGETYHFSLILGKVPDSEVSDSQIISSGVMVSDLKQALGKIVDIERNNRNLEADGVWLTNISLPVYGLLKKSFNLLREIDVGEKYETLVKFVNPIEIHAQCDDNGWYTLFYYCGKPLEFPLIGIMPFRDAKIPKDFRKNN
jgi:hypothetical protein